MVQWLSLPTLRIVTNFREHCMHRRKDNRRYYRISPICVGVDRGSYVLPATRATMPAKAPPPWFTALTTAFQPTCPHRPPVRRLVAMATRLAHEHDEVRAPRPSCNLAPVRRAHPLFVCALSRRSFAPCATRRISAWTRRRARSTCAHGAAPTRVRCSTRV